MAALRLKRHRGRLHRIAVSTGIHIAALINRTGLEPRAREIFVIRKTSAGLIRPFCDFAYLLSGNAGQFFVFCHFFHNGFFQVHQKQAEKKEHCKGYKDLQRGQWFDIIQNKLMKKIQCAARKDRHKCEYIDQWRKKDIGYAAAARTSVFSFTLQSPGSDNTDPLFAIGTSGNSDIFHL